jgi:N-acylneuraminate cytidylyltransferase
MTAVAFIFARGGSKGLPGENIRPLAGKPLIAWSIKHARSVKRIKRVIVSTDSEEIAAVARDFGGEVPFMRPAELARDDSPEWLAWRHALSFLKESEGALPEAMLSVPTTAPLRLPIDLENCLDEFSKGDANMIITVSMTHRNPWYNMVRLNPDGTVGLVVSPASGITRRLDAPAVFDMATVAYVVRPQFVMKQVGTFNGRVRAVKVPVERAIDIDTLLDFELAEFLISRRAHHA